MDPLAPRAELCPPGEEGPPSLAFLPLAEVKLPRWATKLQDHQQQACWLAYGYFVAGYRNVVLEGPTGAGKTLIAECIRQMLQTRALYVCTTKSLQAQFLADFPEARVLQGRNNYRPNTPTARALDATCEGCTYDRQTGECTLCTTRATARVDAYLTCPYQKAKRAAQEADVAVLNTAYFLAAVRGGRGDNVQGWLGFNPEGAGSIGLRGRGLAIFDEADELEGALMSAVEIRLPSKLLAELELTPPGDRSHWRTRLAWAESKLIPRLSEAAGTYNQQIPAERKKAEALYTLTRRTKAMLKEMEEAGQVDEQAEAWVYDVEPDGGAVFKPVRVHRYGQKLLFGSSHLNLIMSATILSEGMFCDDLGLELGTDTAFVRVDSSFSPARRPVYIRPVANVSAQNKTEAYPALGAEIARIAQHYPSQRGVVHTVSFELARYLYDYLRPILGTRVITYSGRPGERDRALAQHARTPGGLILGASLERGINLKHDLGRINIVAKCPFPYLGDKQISKRRYQPTMALGEAWYLCHTLKTIIQMAGRTMRSADDWSRTWILDAQFQRPLRDVRRYVPRWFLDAVVTHDLDLIHALGLDPTPPLPPLLLAA